MPDRMGPPPGTPTGAPPPGGGGGEGGGEGGEGGEGTTTPILRPSNGLSYKQAQANGLTWSQWWNDPATTPQDQINAQTIDGNPAIDPVFAVASGVAAGAQVSKSTSLFGKGTSLNTGQWLRLGHSTPPGSRYIYFSLRGRVIDFLMRRNEAHLDLWRVGPRP
jgi:hypothetical protein